MINTLGVDDEKRLADFLKKFPEKTLDLPILYDKDNKFCKAISKSLGEEESIPLQIFVNKQGVIEYKLTGFNKELEIIYPFHLGYIIDKNL
ncbi:MAG: hypothetical protein NZ551_08825 [Microscillaceae bacterium]|nr:hypothetical protein [Microscillaceae bacterium]MDW8461303.1 hypothetical protein [Cytophagales bacterium]